MRFLFVISVRFVNMFSGCQLYHSSDTLHPYSLWRKPYIMKVVKAHGPTKVDHETHFTHPPSPRTTSSAFPHQPEWQAFEQMRENQPHNGCFATLFYKALVQGWNKQNVTQIKPIFDFDSSFVVFAKHFWKNSVKIVSNSRKKIPQ